MRRNSAEFREAQERISRGMRNRATALGRPRPGSKPWCPADSLEWLPRDWCFECGGTHKERLKTIVRMMQPVTAQEIRTEYPHLFGPPSSDRRDFMARRLNRALHEIGAVIDAVDITWSLPAAKAKTA